MEEIVIVSMVILDIGMKYLMKIFVVFLNFCFCFYRKVEVKIISDYCVLVILSFL